VKQETIKLLLQPELAQLRSHLKRIKFYGTDPFDIVLLVRDGGCERLTSIVLDVEASSFLSGMTSWKDAEKHSAAMDVIRGLEDIDVELCVPDDRRVTIRIPEMTSVSLRCVDMNDWKEKFPEEVELSKKHAASRKK